MAVEQESSFHDASKPSRDLDYWNDWRIEIIGKRTPVEHPPVDRGALDALVDASLIDAPRPY